jgi:hypothetical protein
MQSQDLPLVQRAIRHETHSPWADVPPETLGRTGLWMVEFQGRMFEPDEPVYGHPGTGSLV